MENSSGQDRIDFLINEFLFGRLDEIEMYELAKWINKKYAHLDFFSEVNEKPGRMKELGTIEIDSQRQNIVLKYNLQFQKPAPAISSTKYAGWYKYIVAASVVVAISLLAFYFINHYQKTSSPQVAIQQTDSLYPEIPGILVLANGDSLHLKTIRDGIIAIQGPCTIEKKKGELIYHVNDSAATNTGLFNKILSGYGSSFNVILPDGSKTRLNARSSIHLPVIFDGRERKVSLTGEAYFDVVKKPFKRFIVRINDDTRIEVLGTKFNVNAYEDENDISVTLVEGLVNLISDKKKLRLKPGHQAIVSNSKHEIRIHNADTSLAIAWKENRFAFKTNDLGSIAKQIKRWYNADIVLVDKRTNRSFSGTLTRFNNLDSVIKVLNQNNIEVIQQKNNIPGDEH